jgi:biotin operon repressor
MKEEDRIQQLIQFFKALSDPNRLKIVGLLAQKDLSVEQLAELIGVGSSTVSHHLARLSKAGLVSARTESYYSIYHLNTGQLESLSKEILAGDTLPAVTADINLDAYDQKVIRNYTNEDGTLKSIPNQMKKLLAVLRDVSKDFQSGIVYSEKEVNAILEKYHQDYAQLRRELVEFKLMAREGGGGSYWLLDQSEN